MFDFIPSCLCRPSSLHSEGFKGRRSLPYKKDLTPVQRTEEAHLYPCYTQSASFQQSQFPSFVVVTVNSEIDRHPCCSVYYTCHTHWSHRSKRWSDWSALEGQSYNPPYDKVDIWKEILTSAPGCWHRPHKLHTFLAKLERRSVKYFASDENLSPCWTSCHYQEYQLENRLCGDLSCQESLHHRCSTESQSHLLLSQWECAWCRGRRTDPIALASMCTCHFPWDGWNGFK